MQPVRRAHETAGGIGEAHGDLYDSSAERLAPGDVRFPVRGSWRSLHIQRLGWHVDTASGFGRRPLSALSQPGGFRYVSLAEQELGAILSTSRAPRRLPI